MKKLEFSVKITLDESITNVNEINNISKNIALALAHSIHDGNGLTSEDNDAIPVGIEVDHLLGKTQTVII